MDKNRYGLHKMDRCQLCSKYVYTGAGLYGDLESISEMCSSGKERVAVVLSSRLSDQVFKVGCCRRILAYS
jgi:hypothetical protein